MNQGYRSVGRKMTLIAGLVVVLGAATAAVGESPVRVTVDANSVWIHAGDAALLQYRYDHVPFKPYVKKLFTPGGLNLLLDAPHDHLHHHALMFAIAAEGVNFWEETATAGRQGHGGFLDVVIAEHGGVPTAGFAERVHWTHPQGRGVLTERRTIEACRVEKLAATVVTWESRLTPSEGGKPMTLTGSHYFGLGMRFVRSMDAVGEFSNADHDPGVIFRGEERLVRSNWCAYTVNAPGAEVTVAMFGHPGNRRHPTTWFTMAKPFAYLSATLNLHAEPLTVAAGEPLVLRYAVAVWDGRVEDDRIAQTYEWIVKDYGPPLRAAPQGAQHD